LKTRLPPNQKKVNKFPVLQAGGVPSNIQKSDWTLEIYGAVETPTTFTYDEFIELPAVKINADIHCVTGWSLFDTEWEGILFRTIVEIVQPIKGAKFVVFECADVNGTFTTSLPLQQLMGDDTILAFKYKGQELSVEHGGPVRAIVPQKYFYKSAKWITKIKFIEEDEVGYWESRGYSNTADPWKEERYSR